MTGKNPGKHGIFDFIRRGKSDYKGVPINASLRDGDTLWHLLSRAGKRVGVLSVPATYPPEPVNGFMVTGMLTPPDATDYTYPPELAQELQRAVPSFTMITEGTAHALGREDRLLDGLERLTDINMETIRYLMSRYEWDFFMMVFKETDVAMHWLWRFIDQRHPWHVGDAPERLRLGLRQCYQRMDACLAELAVESRLHATAKKPPHQGEAIALSGRPDAHCPVQVNHGAGARTSVDADSAPSQSRGPLFAAACFPSL
jgi:predicted AlkP superfamily phosphohydrolase/phosphomutase